MGQKLGLDGATIKHYLRNYPPAQWSMSRERYDTVALNMVVLRDAVVHGHLAFIFVGSEVFEPSLTKVFRDTYREKLTPARGQIAQHHSGPHAIIFSYFYTNYWHWHLQCLPNILLLEQAGLLHKVKIVVPILNDWQRQSLLAMGVSADQLVEITDAGHSFDHLIHCPFAGGQGDDLCPIVVEIFERIRKTLGVVAEPCGPKVYISRMDSVIRQVVNEAEVIAGLQSMGYEAFTPGVSDYASQVEALSGASFIVGTHGAGLTNVGFARYGCLFEIFPETYLRAAYAVQASILNQPYTFCTYPVEENGFGHIAHARGMKWHIPVAELMRRVFTFEKAVRAGAV
jgi:hypothetical protein